MQESQILTTCCSLTNSLNPCLLMHKSSLNVNFPQPFCNFSIHHEQYPTWGRWSTIPKGTLPHDLRLCTSFKTSWKKQSRAWSTLHCQEHLHIGDPTKTWEFPTVGDGRASLRNVKAYMTSLTLVKKLKSWGLSIEASDSKVVSWLVQINLHSYQEEFKPLW